MEFASSSTADPELAQRQHELAQTFVAIVESGKSGSKSFALTFRTDLTRDQEVNGRKDLRLATAYQGPLQMEQSERDRLIDASDHKPTFVCAIGIDFNASRIATRLAPYIASITPLNANAGSSPD